MTWPPGRPPRFLRGRPTRIDVGCNAPAVGVDRGDRSPASPVTIRRCTSYRLDEVAAALKAMLADLGGLASFVAGKTVAVKVNFTGPPGTGCLSRPASHTYRPHPSVALALAMLLDAAGARRIRFLDGPSSALGLEEFAALDGWDLAALASLRARVEFENTRNRGAGPDYAQLRVPGGGSLFPAYWIRRAYIDCDVVVSLAKLKNHTRAGVTLTAKNLFGITPLALYGRGEVDEDYVGSRRVLHRPEVRPPAGLPLEVVGAEGCDELNRIARHIVDALSMRPVDLAIIDGVATVAGGAGPWASGLVFIRPRLLIAGRNPVCTDAVATACKAYDPAAPCGTGPFPGDNHLRLAAEAGLGSIDLERIEVRGRSIEAARYEFGWRPKQSRPEQQRSLS